MESVKHFDLTIEKENLEDNVREFLIQVFPALEKHEIDVRVFPKGVKHGLVNTMIKCSWTNDSVKPEAVIVRVQNMEDFKEYFTNRSSEALYVQILHKRNCAPRVIATFKNGFCYEYLKGEVLSSVTIAQEPVCWLVAKELAKIHASHIDHEALNKTPLFDEGDLSEKFQSKFPTELKDPAKNKRFQKEYPSSEQLQEELAATISHLKSLHLPVVLCHNDVKSENIVYNEKEGKATFVDFEALRYNYQAFEVARYFACFCGFQVIDYSKYPTKEFQKKWIRIYLAKYYEELGKKTEDITDLEIEQMLVLVEKCHLFNCIMTACYSPVLENFGMPLDFLSIGITSYKKYLQDKEEILAKAVPQ